MANFVYGETELDYLRSRDARLADAIARIGHVERAVDPDLFAAVVHHIIGQQISTKAQATIWTRLQERLGAITPATVRAAGRDGLQAVGTTFRKADYIMDFADRVSTAELDLDAIGSMPDEDAIAELVTIRGIGRWTAEMILLFCLERPDILSFDDLAIQRGLRMLYRHRRITPALFARHRRRFSPYGSVASLYLWAIAGGALPELTDPAARTARGGGAGRKQAERSRSAARPPRTADTASVPANSSLQLATYDSPLGKLTLAADDQGLAGAWFAGQAHFGEFGSVRHTLPATPDQTAAESLSQPATAASIHVLEATRAWLDAYFAGEKPSTPPKLHLMGSPFQQRVWQLLVEIPYGTTTTYGALAHELEQRFGMQASARAVGGAVGRNPVSIIVPCHRVLGADGSITGYAGGPNRKRALLALERSS